MTDDAPAERGLREHPAFEATASGFVVTTTAFEGRVVLDRSHEEPRFRVVVRVPTIDSVVAGEAVAPVVREGWLETFELRLEDVGGVTRLEPSTPTVELDRAAEEVVVESSLPAARPGVAAEDAKAVVDYVEGTYVEGVIPGYDYREPVAGLVDRARAQGER